MKEETHKRLSIHFNKMEIFKKKFTAKLRGKTKKEGPS
jgi:hypothetical protein